MIRFSASVLILLLVWAAAIDDADARRHCEGRHSAATCAQMIRG